MRRRRAVATCLAMALLSGLVVLCPCPVPAQASDDHGCCASEGIRAATTCCPATQAPDASDLARVAALTQAPAQTDLFVDLTLRVEAHPLARPARSVAPPSAVLRI
ncbi:MAG TPA: hypothetical protein VFM88_09595 [Vicinamibacteria bacterium]|nr:hypothetical protein [Vicinamibacteria bacterium]